MATNFFDLNGGALEDENGDLIFAKGASVPGAVAGYAKGCIFLDTDSSTTVLYVNEGTAATADFRVIDSQSSLTLTPTAADTAGVNVIPAGVKQVRLGANVTDVNDFVVLPSLASVPNGHEITIIAGAANCEVRTPATSAEEINSEDCDGTKEYLLTATQIHKFIKIDSTIGWMGHGYSAIGAVVTAVVPD